MAKFHTTDSLIESVKMRAMVPESQNTFKEDQFLNFINEEMDIGIVPQILIYHEDHLLVSVDIPLVAGQDKYPIPSRAIGNKLKDVHYKDTSGSLYEMTRVDTGDVTYFQYGLTNGVSVPLKAFYTEGDSVCLLPFGNNVSSGYIRLQYYTRPNAMVSKSRVGVVSSINFTTGEITLESMPTVFNTNEKFDIIKARSPFNCTAYDFTATSISGNIITFTPGSLPTSLKKGDYVNLAEESFVPQVPSELHSMLAQRVACRCLEAMGDRAGLEAANAKLAEMEQKTGSLIDNRVENAPQKVINRHGFLRLSRRFFRR